MGLVTPVAGMWSEVVLVGRGWSKLSDDRGNQRL